MWDEDDSVEAHTGKKFGVRHGQSRPCSSSRWINRPSTALSIYRPSKKSPFLVLVPPAAVAYIAMNKVFFRFNVPVI